MGCVVVSDLGGSGMHHHEVEVPSAAKLDVRAGVGSLKCSEEGPRGPADRECRN